MFPLFLLLLINPNSASSVFLNDSELIIEDDDGLDMFDYDDKMNVEVNNVDAGRYLLEN